MKKVILASFLLSLSACSSIPTSPGVISNQTVLDEKVLIAVELAYKTEVLAIETGINTGVIAGAAAVKIADLDNKAYLAVLVARNAYATGNASTYLGAVASARAAVAGLARVVK